MKINKLFRKIKYPIELFDKNGNRIYFKNSNYWEIREYVDNKEIYFLNSMGYWYIHKYDMDNDKLIDCKEGNLSFIKKILKRYK